MMNFLLWEFQQVQNSATNFAFKFESSLDNYKNYIIYFKLIKSGFRNLKYI
jgi:hypothetical protein